MSKMRALITGILLVCILVMGRYVSAEEEIIVSAASSLTGVMLAVQRSFETAEPSVRLILNFASSGSLLQQIRLGAPVDVYLSASDSFMDRAAEGGLIRVGTRRIVAANSLVLITPAASFLADLQLRDLKKDTIKRIAIGTPKTVPAGRYAKNAMTNAGLWQVLESKLIFGNNVRQVLDYTIRGEVDAGFVYKTDAFVATGKVKTAAIVKNTGEIHYPAAVTTASEHTDAGLIFLRFITTEKGQAVFASFGFKMLHKVASAKM